jgi:hypothetical protein
MLDRALEWRREEGHEQLFTDILYRDLVSDAPGQLARIYERHGGISSSLELKFSHTEQQNPQNKYGKHTYSFKDFGLNMDLLSQRNGAYLELFASLNHVIHPQPQYHVKN